MKRKKLSKLIALAASLTLALSVGMVASATGSPKDDNRVLLETEDGKTLVAQDGVGTGAAAEAAAEVLSDPQKIKETLIEGGCKHVPEAVRVLNVQNIELLDKDGQPIKDQKVFESVFPNGVDVRVDAPGAKVGDVIYVIHWLSDGSGYEVLPATVVAAGGEVVVHMDSLSPIAVIKVTKANGSAPELKVVDTRVKSPKTGK